MIKVGVVGQGNAGRGHVRNYLALPDVEVVAVCDADEARLASAAREHNVRHAFTDYRKMAQLKDLDAVIVALPNFLHQPVALAFLHAGKDVLVEKPMARTAEEAEPMLHAARENGRILMVNMSLRCTPGCILLKELVASGRLGEVYHINAFWVRPKSFGGERKRITWFVDKEKSGGGALIDLGIHILDFSLWLMNDFDPVSVSACVHSEFFEQVDDYAAVLIELAGNKSISLQTAWEGHFEERLGFSVLGTKAGVELCNSDMKLYSTESGVPCKTVYELPSNSSLETNTAAHFINCVKKREEPEPSGEIGLKLMRILDAIYQSQKG